MGDKETLNQKCQRRCVIISMLHNGGVKAHIIQVHYFMERGTTKVHSKFKGTSHFMGHRLNSW
eukprot:scaffold12272_cov277-Chaetoceros_neogracile.AAC.1